MVSCCYLFVLETSPTASIVRLFHKQVINWFICFIFKVHTSELVDAVNITSQLLYRFEFTCNRSVFSMQKHACLPDLFGLFLLSLLILFSQCLAATSPLIHMLMSIQHVLLDLQLVYALTLLQKFTLAVLKMDSLWYVNIHHNFIIQSCYYIYA